MYIYIYTYVCIRVYVYVINMYVHTYMYIYIYIYINTNTDIRTVCMCKIVLRDRIRRIPSLCTVNAARMSMSAPSTDQLPSSFQPLRLRERSAVLRPFAIDQA